MTLKAGIFGKLYRATVSEGSATLGNELKVVKDVDTNLTKDSIECNDRSNNGFKKYIPGLKDFKISTSINFDPEDQDCKDLVAAWESDTPYGLAVLQQDKAVAAADGNFGLIGTFNVSIANWKQPLNEAQTLDIECSLVEYIGKHP